MVSLVAVLTLSAALTAPVAQAAKVQPADFQGSWTGTAFIEGRGENQVWLDLKVEAGQCTGIIKDAMGLVARPDILNVKIEKQQITFDLTAANENGTFPVHLLLDLDGDTLSGRWWSDPGETGAVKLTRKSAR